MHFFVPLAFLSSLPSSVKNEYVLGLKVTNYVIIFPPSSSFIKPMIFLFFPVGNGLRAKALVYDVFTS